jgi:cytochrome c-type biogenesis protein CcmF
MKTAVVKVSINPLVNWLWLGGTLMCLFPFLGLGRRRKEA